MKTIILIFLLVLVSCSTSKVKEDGPSDQITDASFRREKPLVAKDIPDFYTENTQSLNPALQDETLDRYSSQELSQVKDNEDPLLAIAVRCLRGEFDEALALASRSFDRYQKIAAYWNQVANCHLNQGAQRKALLFYNKALEVSPNYVPALNNIGVLYSRQGQDQKALVAFERAHKQSKFAKTPRYNLAKLYLSYGLADAALPLFQGLLSLAPGDVDLLNAVATSFYLTSNYQNAMDHYRRIPADQWKRPEIGLNVALTLSRLGSRDDARRVFEAVDRPEQGELKQYYAIVGNRIGESK